MPFSQADIIQVYPPIAAGRQVYLSWQSSATPGSVFYQVYIDQQLSWWGAATSCYVAIPAAGVERIDIGSVLPGEQATDFSSSLPGAPARRARISFLGGVFEGPDLAGFRIYGPPSPGSPIDYTTALATMTAYPGGIDTSGWGLGGWGLGGWGSTPGLYSWDSGPLISGVYSFAVVPFDSAGNPGTPQTTTLTIAVPPLEPPLFADGITRLEYALDGWGSSPWGVGGWGDPEVALNWNPSTG
jgi:hypothetical protein